MKPWRFQYLPDEVASKQPIVLFDGACTLCSSSLRFIIRHNHSGNLNFASLQSKVGLRILKLAGKKFQQNDTLLLIEDNIMYSYSTAALRITAYLGFPWHLMGMFLIVPALIRDSLYRYIAKNRYAWFGRKSFCVADQKEHNRFLT